MEAVARFPKPNLLSQLRQDQKCLAGCAKYRTRSQRDEFSSDTPDDVVSKSGCELLFPVTALGLLDLGILLRSSEA